MNPYKYQTFNTLTPLGRRKRAEFFIGSIRDPYIVLGKTTAWGNPDIPPVDFPNDIENILQPFTYKKVISIDILEGNACNITNSNKFSYIDSGLIKTYKEDAVKVVITAQLYSEEIAGVSFRMMGLLSNVIKKPSAPPGADRYTPNQILDSGDLHWFSISTPLTLNIEFMREINIVLIF